jgi:AcrR family transcriptional regulator
MAVQLSSFEAAQRRTKILEAARWCLLNFGFAKTSLEDIAKRASLSRTLLYRTFKDKEEIFGAVFEDWVISRRPRAEEAAARAGRARARLLEVCRIMVLEPWEELICTPMGGEFLEACARIAPEREALHQEIMLGCVSSIIGDRATAEVFLLSLDGLLSDQPSMTILDQRIEILADRFVSSSIKRVKQHD